MKKSDKTAKPTHRRADPNVMGLRADVVEQNITETLETLDLMKYFDVVTSGDEVKNPKPDTEESSDDSSLHGSVFSDIEDNFKI